MGMILWKGDSRRGRLWAIGILVTFLAGFLGGGVAGYLQSREEWKRFDPNCMLCTLQKEGKVRFGGKGLGLLQFHSNQGMLLEFPAAGLSGAKASKSRMGLQYLSAGDFGSTIRAECGGNVGEIYFSVSEDCVWDLDLDKVALCENCKEELSRVLIQQGDWDLYYDVVFLDLKSGQIVPVIPGIRAYATETYYFHFDYYEDGVEILTLCNP